MFHLWIDYFLHHYLVLSLQQAFIRLIFCWLIFIPFFLFLLLTSLTVSFIIISILFIIIFLSIFFPFFSLNISQIQSIYLSFSYLFSALIISFRYLYWIPLKIRYLNYYFVMYILLIFLNFLYLQNLINQN